MVCLKCLIFLGSNLSDQMVLGIQNEYWDQAYIHVVGKIESTHSETPPLFFKFNTRALFLNKQRMHTVSANSEKIFCNSLWTYM